jgi:hypothetical protein
VDVRRRGRVGFAACLTAGGDCATFFTFVGAAGRACGFAAGRAGFSAAGCTDPPAQPAARIGTRTTQLAARAVANDYPVNFGCAFLAVAAGAVPPPPPVSVVVVVSVAVVSVDVESVGVEPVVEVESGVVVVIVVTTVVLPVVMVVTIVVVASAPNGAAPAVNAAVAAPSVISAANAAPHTAYFLYSLFIPPPCPFLSLQERLTHLAE